MKLRIKKSEVSEKQGHDVTESNPGGSSIAITDPDLASAALQLEKQKQQITKTYNDQMANIENQLQQLMARQITLTNSQNQQAAAAQKQQPAAEEKKETKDDGKEE